MNDYDEHDSEINMMIELQFDRFIAFFCCPFFSLSFHSLFVWSMRLWRSNAHQRSSILATRRNGSKLMMAKKHSFFLFRVARFAFNWWKFIVSFVRSNSTVFSSFCRNFHVSNQTNDKRVTEWREGETHRRNIDRVGAFVFCVFSSFVRIR